MYESTKTKESAHPPNYPKPLQPQENTSHQSPPWETAAQSNDSTIHSPRNWTTRLSANCPNDRRDEYAVVDDGRMLEEGEGGDEASPLHDLWGRRLDVLRSSDVEGDFCSRNVRRGDGCDGCNRCRWNELVS